METKVTNLRKHQIPTTNYQPGTTHRHHRSKAFDNVESARRAKRLGVWNLNFLWCLVLGFWSFRTVASSATLQLTLPDYEDRVHAIWTAQIAAVLMGFQFEHKVASTEWVDR